MVVVYLAAAQASLRGLFKCMRVSAIVSGLLCLRLGLGIRICNHEWSVRVRDTVRVLRAISVTWRLATLRFETPDMYVHANVCVCLCVFMFTYKKCMFVCMSVCLYA